MCIILPFTVRNCSSRHQICSHPQLLLCPVLHSSHAHIIPLPILNLSLVARSCPWGSCPRLEELLELPNLWVRKSSASPNKPHLSLSMNLGNPFLWDTFASHRWYLQTLCTLVVYGNSVLIPAPVAPQRPDRRYCGLPFPLQDSQPGRVKLNLMKDSSSLPLSDYGCGKSNLSSFSRPGMGWGCLTYVGPGSIVSKQSG